MKKCASCGASTEDKANFCPNCGGDTFIVKGTVYSKSKSNNIFIIVALCILVGALAIVFSEKADDGTQKGKTTEASYFSGIELDRELQYKLNLFLSNFSERKIESFVGIPDEKIAVDFAVSYTFRNNNEYFEKLRPDVEVNGRSFNQRVNEKVIEETILDNFDLSKLPKDFGKGTDRYSDGYYYFIFTGATIFDDSTIVTEVKQTADDTYEVYFKLYNAFGYNDKMHSKSIAQVQEEMKENPGIKYVEDGMAVIRSENIRDYSTYRLAEYHLY